MQTIDRAFGVLRSLADRSGTSTLAEVSEGSGLPKSTTSRILAALEELGMVDRVGGRYSIGSGLATLTHGASPVGSLRDLAWPSLLALADELGENAALAVADRDRVLYVDSVDGPGAVQVQSWTGERVLYHGSAAGLALMTGWTDEDIAGYAERGLEALTPATVTSPIGLERRMAQVRSDGFAWTRAEFSDEVNGLAAPVSGPQGGVVGALTVYGPIYRFPGDRSAADVERVVSEAAADVAGRLA